VVVGVAPGPSKPVIAEGVGGPAPIGLAAKGLPARDPPDRGFGDDWRDGGLGLARRDAALGVSTPLSFLPWRLGTGVTVPARSLSFFGFF